MTDKIVLPSGKALYANEGIVGIGPDLSVSQGYDGGIDGADLKCIVEAGWDEPDSYEHLSAADKLGLADMMIERWQQYRQKVIEEGDA